MKKKILKIFAALIFINGLSQNQTNINLPTSPEVAMFKRFGDIPVSLYTGTVNTSIPLYDFEQYGFSIPISLNYSGSGIKLDDQATWVGLGWNLMPEGIIYQDVRGKPDQSDISYTSPTAYTKFYSRISTHPGGTGRFKVMNQRGYSDYDWCLPPGTIPACFPPSNPVNSDPDVVVQDLVYRKEGEVDTFRFNFFGHSGSFFINLQTRQVVLLDKSENIDLKIEHEKITATDDKGIKYIFAQKETFQSIDGTPPDYASRSYKITEILLPTKHRIYFEYQDGNYSFDTYSQSRNIDRPGGYNMSPNSTCFGKIDYLYNPPIPRMNVSNVKILKRIKTDDLLVEFNLSDRDDINLYSYNSLKKLQSIDVINIRSNKKLKTIDLTYTYFPYVSDFPAVANAESLTQVQKDALGKRLKLDKISLYGYDSLENKISIGEEYNLDYYTDVTLPPKVSFAKDFWGYYNGHGGNILLPNLRFYLESSSGIPVSYEGSNRYANKVYANTYMLKKIQYPSKGYTEFEYESNSFENQFIPSHDQVTDLSRTESLNNTGVGGYSSPHKDTLTIKVTASPRTIKFINRFSGGFDGGPYGPQSKRYDYYQLVNAGASIQFLKVKKNADGTLNTQMLKQWDLASMTNAATFNQNYNYEWEELYTIGNVDPDPTTRYMVKLNINNNMYIPADLYHSAGVFSTVSYIDSPPVNSGFKSLGHGARIASIKNYSSEGTLSEWKKYEYYDGILQNTISPLKQNDYYCFDCTPASYCSNYVSYRTFWVITDQVSSSEYDAVGYGKVTESNVDITSPTQSKGKIEYSYYNFENKTADYFPVIKNQLNGLLMGKMTKDANNDPVQSETYKYKNLIPFNQFYSVRAQLKFLLGGNRKDPLLGTTGEYDAISKYHFYATPMMSESHRIDSIITKRYLGNQIILGKQHFEYNDLGLVKKKEEIYDDATIFTEYKYTGDVGNYYLNQKDITGIPLVVETKKTTNGVTKPFSIVETYYPESAYEAQNMTSGLPLPYMTGSYGPNLQNERIIYYNQYDSKGNLLQYKMFSDYVGVQGTPVAIIWGYNKTRPIAKIEGATYPKSGDPKPTDIPQALIDLIVAASDADALQAVGNDESAILLALDNFRKDPLMKNYQITTYTYDPLIGVRSITPPSGVREVYVYDTANRLKEVRDINGRIIKENKYNYKQ